MLLMCKTVTGHIPKKTETPVVSNNSAHRGTNDVPMVIPEINNAHVAVIETQKARLGTKRGFIAVKPNCSIQSYVPMLTPLLKYGIETVVVSRSKIPMISSKVITLSIPR